MKYKYLDLFAGAGGFSIGMELAGLEPAGFVEWDNAAIAAHLRALPESPHLGRDICEFRAESLYRKVDVIVGSPPCPTFSSNGRSALGEALHTDDRQHLWMEWVRVVQEVGPAIAIMENAPGMVWHGGENIAERIAEELRHDYFTRYTVLDAARYGVPQHRERLYLVAIRRDVADHKDVWGPFPEARFEAPARPVPNRAMKHVLPVRDGSYRVPPAALDSPPARVLWDVIGDLPRKAGEGSPLDDIIDEADPLYAHWTRRLSPRDAHLVALMRQGDNYADMVRAAQAVNKRAGHLVYAIPPQDPDKFRTRWFRLYEDQPSITITHHLGHSGLTHLHPTENRSITIREAARIQTFPDWVLFPGGIGESMFQIGNAVPPLLAEQFGRMCIDLLDGTWRNPHV